jgi:pimeloyl-ACP methyl ester carboxylesterase
LRAHGGTGRIGPTAAFTFDGLADDVAALLDALNLAQPVLAVGVSMGAGIALNLALRYPARIAALALVRPAWLDQPMPPHLGAYPQIAALLRTAGPATGLARFKRAPSYRDVLARSPAAAASMRAQFTAPHAVTRAVRLDRMPHSVPYCDRAELRRLRQPALVIAARGDPTHPLAVAETTAAALPHASSRLVGSRDEDAAGQLAQIRTEVTGFLGRAVVPR